MMKLLPARLECGSHSRIIRRPYEIDHTSGNYFPCRTVWDIEGIFPMQLVESRYMKSVDDCCPE